MASCNGGISTRAFALAQYDGLSEKWRLGASSVRRLAGTFQCNSLCDTGNMPPSQKADPKSVKVNLTAGTGMDIEWKDGHRSSYSFKWLRDACPCALCDEERGKSGREPGEAPKLAPGTLPMFKPPAKPLQAEAVGKYAIRFQWNDGHELGIYSWDFLREYCPCEACAAERAEKAKAE